MNTISCGVELDLRANANHPDGYDSRHVLCRVRDLKPGWTLKLLVDSRSTSVVLPQMIGQALPDGVRIQVASEDALVVERWARELTERTLLDLMVANVADSLNVENERPW